MNMWDSLCTGWPAGYEDDLRGDSARRRASAAEHAKTRTYQARPHWRIHFQRCWFFSALSDGTAAARLSTRNAQGMAAAALYYTGDGKRSLFKL